MTHLGKQETTRDALTVLRKWIERHGVPSALYTDRKSLYMAERKPSDEEKRQGSGALTDFGRVCWRLGIEIIFAHSPQAKGRVERKNGLFQDRLVKELRLREISETAAANAMLDPFVESLDQRFAVAARSPVDDHRQAPAREILDEIFCWESKRTVQNDWTLTHEGRVYQIKKQEGVPAPRAKVTVRRRWNDTIGIYYKDRSLDFALVGSH